MSGLRHQRHLPLPLAGAGCPLGGKGDQALAMACRRCTWASLVGTKTAWALPLAAVVRTAVWADCSNCSAGTEMAQARGIAHSNLGRRADPLSTVAAVMSSQRRERGGVKWRGDSAGKGAGIAGRSVEQPASPRCQPGNGTITGSSTGASLPTTPCRPRPDLRPLLQALEAAMRAADLWQPGSPHRPIPWPRPCLLWWIPCASSSGCNGCFCRACMLCWILPCSALARCLQREPFGQT